MHRTYLVPCVLRWSFLVFGALHLAGLTAFGQPPAGSIVRREGEIPVITVPVNQTKQVEMSKKQIIKEARNENPKVARISPIEGNANAILVTGLLPGVTRITLIDDAKRTEYIDIKVPDEDLEKRRELLQRLLREQIGNSQIESTLMPNNTVLLTGTVAQAESIPLALEIARAIFQGRGGDPRSAPNVIHGLRVGGVQQVQLEVKVCSVNRSQLRNMTFSWVSVQRSSFLGSVLGSPLNYASTLSNTSGTLTATPNIVFGVLRNSTTFTGFLEALTQERLAKTLSEPRVTTTSGKAAIFVSGGETPVIASSGQGAPQISYKRFGTVIQCLPLVLGEGKINLEIASELSARDDAAGITIPGIVPTIVPGFKTRMSQVNVQLEDGQTVAIGGLIQSSVNASVQKLPVLGDLPFLGVAFTSKAYTEEEEELIMLVTPRLIDPMNCTQIPQYLPGRETRTADDFELFLEGILEAPRGQRVVGMHPHTYEPAYKVAPNLGEYPCGDQGRCARPGPTHVGVSHRSAIGRCETPAQAVEPVSARSQPVAPPAVPQPVQPQPFAPAGGAPVVPAVMPESAPSVPVPPLAPGETEGVRKLPQVKDSTTTGPISAVIPARFETARELESRPVLPPVTFGPVMNDNR